MIFRTYKGKRLDLQHYKSMSIVEYEFQIFDYDDNEVDLSLYENIELNVYQKKHGTLVNSYDLSDGLSLGSPDYNIYWDASIEDMNLIQKPYYHECIGVLSDGRTDLLFHGISEII